MTAVIYTVLTLSLRARRTPAMLGLTALTLVAGCSPTDRPAVYVPPPQLAGERLPDVSDPGFCQALLEFLDGTTLVSENIVYDTVQGYVESKTSIRPLTSHQYTTVRAGMPVAISCKIKGSKYLNVEYGQGSAAEQRFCPAATAVIVNTVANALDAAGNGEAAARARAFVLDNNEPVFAGPNYLAAFELSYTDEAGDIHLASPGLFHDYDHWSTAILPDDFIGPVYCHLPSHEYVTALATGAEQPGWVMDMRGEE